MTVTRTPNRPTRGPWMTIKEAAEYLGVGVDTIYDACARRGLKHAKLGHSTIRIRLEDLEAWAAAQVRQTP